MRVREIALKNFRSCRDQVTIKDLNSVNICIGPNNAGKSNIIEVFKYLKRLLAGNQLRPFVDMVFDRELKREIEITMKFTFDDDERSSIISSLFEGNQHIEKDEVKRSQFLRDLTYNIRIKNKGIISEKISITNIEGQELTIVQKIQNPKREGVAITNVTNIGEECKNLPRLENISEKFVQKTENPVTFQILQFPKLGRGEEKIINALRKFINTWEWFEPIRNVTPRMPLGEEKNLAPSGTNLTKFMNTLQTSNPRQFVKLVDDVIKILPMISEILAPPKGNQATINIQEKGLKAEIDVGNISFGVMQVLILVVGIVTKTNGSVILIEEPEIHLHATSQRRLFELIQREADEKQKQFFITTHSTIFTACNEKKNTYLVTKKDGTTRVRRIEEPKELKIIKNILGHRNTDLYNDECVVFIEGDSEEVAFPIIAEAMGYDFIEKGIRLINIKGKGKAKKLGEYLRYLRDADVLTYIIADGDKEVKKKIEDWKREGILEDNCVTIWNLEFEDCFSSELLSKAINELAKERGLGFKVTTDELEKIRDGNKPIMRQLMKMLEEKSLPSIDKPELAEKLAMLLAEDIKKPEHQKTRVEQVIEEIVNLVERKVYSNTG